MAIGEIVVGQAPPLKPFNEVIVQKLLRFARRHPLINLDEENGREDGYVALLEVLEQTEEILPSRIPDMIQKLGAIEIEWVRDRAIRHLQWRLTCAEACL